MWSTPKFGNEFVDLSSSYSFKPIISNEERRRMKCEDICQNLNSSSWRYPAVAGSAQKLNISTREILIEPIQIGKFSISSEKLKNKYEGMLQLSCILSQDDVMEFAEELFENKSCTVLFNLKVLGLHAFFKMDEENLKKKLKNLDQNEADLAFIFIILLYALIEEDIKSSNDIYSLILQHSRNNKLITYIIRLIQAYENKEIGYDFFGINPSYLECFAMAIHIFISHNDNPQKVVDQALQFDKSVLRFLTWMLGASYGFNWIPQEWLKFSPNFTNLIEKLL